MAESAGRSSGGRATWPRRRSGRGRTTPRPLGQEPLERRLALAVTTPFGVRFTADTTGDITFAANTLMTAPASAGQAAIDAQNGVGSEVNNNDFQMAYVDIDADPATFNSSAAELVLPAGASVLFAGLYWSGRTSNSAPPGGQTQFRNSVKLMAPGDASYRDLTGATIGTTGSSYQAFLDVTSIVQSDDGGAGRYMVANVRAIADSDDKYAGWSLVVAYQAPGEPARNLTVFDGYGSVNDNDPAIDIRIEGFKAPPSGPVNATLGFITYEGDLGYDGDKVFFDGGKGPKQLQNAANPKNNFFNSTISNRGSLVSTKDPNYVNQMGFDADLVAANDVIANGATGATISLTTGGETYYPGVVTSAIELFAPEVTVDKSVADADGDGLAEPNEVLTYTIVVSNAADALDAAVNVLLQDAIPAHTTFKPGSLQIVSGANSGAKTDAVDADQGEYFSGTDAVWFQLGTGAGAGTGIPKGGTLAAGQSTTVTFQVVVDSAPLPVGTLVENTAVISYKGRTSGLSLTAIDSANIPAPPTAANLSVTKTDGKSQYVPGTQLTYTIVVTNNGPSDLVDEATARVLDVMPAEFSSATWSVAYSTGSAFSNPTSGSGDIDVALNLLDGGTATFTVTATVRPEATGNLTNTVTVSGPADYPDADLSDNTATDTDSLVLPASLAVGKRVRDINGGVVEAGDVLRYTITVSNAAGDGVSPREAAIDVILADLVPTNTSYKPGTLRITSGANAGAKTDASDGDQGEYLAATGTVQFQLGAGAGGPGVGGRLAAGQSTTVTFDVVVAGGILPGTVITNTASATATGELSLLPLEAEGSVGIATPPAADLSVVKSTAASFTPGQNATFTLVVSNAGPTAVTGALVNDDFSSVAALLDGLTWTSVYSSGAAGPSGSGSLSSVPVNLGASDRITFTIVAATRPNWPSNLNFQNTATTVPPAGITDPNPGDNTSTVTTQPIAVTDLGVTKVANRTSYTAGTAPFPVTYTITVTNNGPSFASQASIVDTLDPSIFNVATATWTASFSGTGTTGEASGTGSIGEIIDLAVGGTAVYTVVAQTLSGITSSINNTATVAPTDLARDPDPNNDTSTNVIGVDISPAIIVGNDAACDSTPLVRVIDPVTGAEKASFLAYEPNFRGGVRVYGADVTGDGVPEIITAPGAGRPGEVRVFSQDGVPLSGYSFFPFGEAYRSGVEVAVGDVTGDGTTDLVAGQSRGGLVSVFTVQQNASTVDPVDYVPARSVRPFGAKYRGGVTVATADVGTFPPSYPPSGFSPAADGIMELVVGSGPGIKATVNVYNAVPATPKLVNTIKPISPTYSRGVGVSTLPTTPGQADAIMVTAGTFGGSKVEVYRGIGTTPSESFTAFSGAAANKAAVWSAAFSEEQIYSVQGAGGTTNGVWKKGQPGPLPATSGIRPPLRIGVLRPPFN